MRAWHKSQQSMAKKLTQIPINKIRPPSHKPNESVTPENPKKMNNKLNLSAFSFTSLSEQPMKLSDLKAKVILVSLWATWCEPCRSEQKELDQIYKIYKNHGLEIVAIDQDNLIEKDLIEKFAKSLHLNYKVWLDPMGASKSLFETTAVPTTYLLTLDGKVLSMKTGFQKDFKKQLEKELSTLLAISNEI